MRRLWLFFILLVAFLGCADIPDDLREEAKGNGVKSSSSALSSSSSVKSSSSNYGSSTSSGLSLLSSSSLYSSSGSSSSSFSGNSSSLSSSSLASSSNGSSSSFGDSSSSLSSSSLASSSGGSSSSFSDSSSSLSSSSLSLSNSSSSSSFNNSSSSLSSSSLVSSSSSSSVSICNGTQYNPATQRCQNNIVETKCGTDGWYDATSTNLRCESNVVETKCGIDWYNASTQFCSSGATVYNKCGGVTTYNPATEQCCGSSKYTTTTQFCDSRDSKAYKWVTIGTQTWMAENLNYNVSGSECYNNSTANCTKYGKLYDWATAMGISSSYNSNSYNPSASTKYRGVCPSGWHIPNDSEWDELLTVVGDPSTAGTKLKATSGWNDSGNGTDNYGFSALPGGYFAANNAAFNGIGQQGRWWSAEEHYLSSYGFANYWSMGYDRANVRNDYYGKTHLYSVRCIKD